MRVDQAGHQLRLGPETRQVRGVLGEPFRQVFDGDLVAGHLVPGEHHAAAPAGTELTLLGESGQLPGSHACLQDGRAAGVATGAIVTRRSGLGLPSVG